LRRLVLMQTPRRPKSERSDGLRQQIARIPGNDVPRRARAVGHDVLHLSQLRLSRADDLTVLERARARPGPARRVPSARAAAALLQRHIERDEDRIVPTYAW
jgi:hypothetical protein